MRQLSLIPVVCALLLIASAVANADPIVVADAGGPYVVHIAGGTVIDSLTLDGSGSWSDSYAHPLVAWDWDLDGDLLYGVDDPDGGDPTGLTVALTPSMLAGAVIGDVRTVGLRVSTAAGVSDVATANILFVAAPAVPEPATIALVGLGAAGLALRRRRRHRG